MDWPDQEFQFKAPNGINHNSPKEYIWCDVLGLCGCYSDTLFNLTFELLAKLLAAKRADDAFYYDYEGKAQAETDLQELILHLFSSKELTEHGSSVRGGWLTEEGVKIAELAELPYSSPVKAS